jgi:hypothetical protein
MTQVFSCSNVAQAPASPGLYAWYGRIQIGLPDFRKDVYEGRDLGDERLRDVLARHTLRHALPNVRVSVRSSFEAEWGSVCPELSINGFLGILRGTIGAEDLEDDPLERTIKAVDDTMQVPKKRQLLKSALEHAIPVISAPIYVGVSDNLRDRLARHVAEMSKLAEASRDDTGLRDRLAAEPTHPRFAVRAFVAGFGLDHLEVQVLDFSKMSEETGLQYSTADLRDVAACAEWLLNRWHRPYLGRR